MPAIPSTGANVVDRLGVLAVASTAAAMVAASSGLPSSAASTWRARNGVGATDPMATRTSHSRPSAKRAPRATETVEISSAGRGPDLRNRLTKSGAGRSNTTAVSSSSARLTVLPGPTKKPSSGTRRVRYGAVAPAGQFGRGAQGQQRRDRVAGRRRVADVAAHGGRIADLLAGEVLGRLGTRGRDVGERGVAADGADRRCGTDANLVTRGLDAVQPFDATKVQQFRLVLAGAGFGLRCEVP